MGETGSRAGDPGDEHAVGVIREVVARERVHDVAVASQVRRGDGNDMAVSGGHGEPVGPDQQVGSFRRTECGRDHRLEGRGLTAQEVVQDLFGLRRGHRGSVEERADRALTRP